MLLESYWMYNIFIQYNSITNVCRAQMMMIMIMIMIIMIFKSWFFKSQIVKKKNNNNYTKMKLKLIFRIQRHLRVVPHK